MYVFYFMAYSKPYSQFNFWIHEMNEWMYVCMHICMYICVCMYVHAYMCVYVSPSEYLEIRKHTF
jgi:hypothetical protein